MHHPSFIPSRPFFPPFLPNQKILSVLFRGDIFTPYHLTSNLQGSVVGIPHYPPSHRFAHHTLLEIEEQIGITLTPENTSLLCGTESVQEMYRALGFSVLPCERHSDVGAELTPMDVVNRIVATHSDTCGTNTIEESAALLSSASFSTFIDYPDALRRISRIFSDPLLTESGSLTEERDYETYVQGMSNPDIMQLKADDVIPFIVEGRIADEGCADGALIACLARQFPDADFIGIDLSSEFLANCRERQRRGDFRETYTHFHQRNLMFPIFEPGSIDSTVCNSTTHELWSYGTQEKTVRDYLGLKFRQTRQGGRIIIRDVCGPDGNGNKPVTMWCRNDNGVNPELDPENQAVELGQDYLEGLSTAARFRRFALDFLSHKNAESVVSPVITYSESCVPKKSDCGQHTGTEFTLPLRHACEFMSKFDYTDNWSSELREEFCFWSFDMWKIELRAAGWNIVPGSYAYTSEWQVQNRWEGQIKLKDHEWPITNMVLVGEKCFPSI